MESFYYVTINVSVVKYLHLNVQHLFFLPINLHLNHVLFLFFTTVQAQLSFTSIMHKSN